MPIISNTKIQIGKETTAGTAVAATAIIPVNGDPTAQVEYNAVRDQGRRGLAAVDFQLLQGGGKSAISFDGPALPIAIGHLVYGIMGTVSTGAAVSSVYPHTFTMGATTPTYTIEDANPIQSRKYAYGSCSDLALSFNAADGMLNYSTTWVASVPATVTAASLTAEIAKGWVGIDATVSLAGTATARCTAFTLTLARAQDAIHATGSRSPIRIDPGPLEATFSLTLDTGASSVDDLLTYLGSSGSFTEQALVIACTYGSTTALRAITITFTNANFGDGAATRDLGNGLYAITFSGRGMYNTTDSGPVKILVNNTSTAY